MSSNESEAENDELTTFTLNTGNGTLGCLLYTSYYMDPSPSFNFLKLCIWLTCTLYFIIYNN